MNFYIPDFIVYMIALIAMIIVIIKLKKMENERLQILENTSSNFKGEKNV